MWLTIKSRYFCMQASRSYLAFTHRQPIYIQKGIRRCSNQIEFNWIGRCSCLSFCCVDTNYTHTRPRRNDSMALIVQTSWLDRFRLIRDGLSPHPLSLFCTLIIMLCFFSALSEDRERTPPARTCTHIIIIITITSTIIHEYDHRY